MSSVALFFLSPLLKWLTFTTVLGAVGIAAFFLLPAWVSANTRMLCLIVGVSSLCGGAFYWKAFRDGEQHMTQRIAAKDNAAIRRVDDAQRKVEDCRGGLDWDVTTGTCNRSAR